VGAFVGLGLALGRVGVLILCLMYSDAKTVLEYLKSLPPETRVAIESVRNEMLEHLPEELRKQLNWG